MIGQMVVSGQPRPWASFTNISSKAIPYPKMMNSAEEIATYNDNNSHYCSPVLARKHTNFYHTPEKSPKKDKKWSLGNLFRRKKKESDTSSDEDGHRNFLQRKKKKSDKRKRVNQTVGFDHVVHPSSRQVNGCKNVEDPLAVLSEPTAHRNFIPASDFTTRFVTLKDKENRQELTRSSNSLGSPSVCSLGRRKKVHVKTRTEARKENSKGEESSDDDSQLSVFKSDDSLSKQKDGVSNRRSRAARTQRYLRRMSKDEDVRDQNKLTKLDLQENLKNLQHKPAKINLCYTRSAPPPLQNFSGLTTIPPSHSSHNKYRSPALLPNKYLSYHASYNGNGIKAINDFNNQRSLSCESNICSPISPDPVTGTLPLYKKYPPPPPPRDPRRVITVQNGEGRPISYSFENGYKRSLSEHKPDANHNFLNKNVRSTSEDHISTEPLQRIPLIPRPSSATPDATRLQRLTRAPDPTENQSYRYLTDKNPRSRRPICIQPDSTDQPTWSQKTFNFWRKKDEELTRNRKSSSPLMFTSQTHVTTNIFPPNSVSEPAREEGSPFRPIESSPDEEMKRKSSNLEDALCELEAIYNSLHLGDEDLLDRAEKRETAAAQKRKEDALESRLPQGDFGFDPNFDSTRKQRQSKKSEPNIQTDDMAFRKLNRPRFNTINHPQSSISNVSYLLASPVFNGSVDELPSSVKGDEPDTTLDDVVFRNVMHTNNSLKVVEPQPPFGIPMGPISPASNSDYLHITPEPEPTNICKKVPDVIKDDLAYRSLRKDPNKATALPPYHVNDDVLNGDCFKKKRAVRSLSANIGSLMHKNDVPPGISIHYEDQNITDVADALEMARQILRDKEEKINATRQAFMSDGELKYRRFDSRSPTTRFINTDCDRLEAKPPTPDRRNSRTSKESTPIPSDDAELKRQLRQSTLDELLTSLAVETRENSDKITEELNAIDLSTIAPGETVTSSKDETSSEYVSLREKLMQCVNSELLAANTEELEVTEEIRIDPIHEIVANVVLLPAKLDDDPVATEVFSESDHDYVNVQSAEETERGVHESKDDLLAAFEAIDETLRKMTTKENEGGGEKCFSVEYIALPTKGCAYVQSSHYSFNVVDHCGEEGSKNYVSELCFNNNDNETKFEIGGAVNNSRVDRDLWCGSSGENLDSLKSPKLVQNLSETYKRAETDRANTQLPVEASNVSNLRRHTLDEPKPSCAWYESPGTVALACSFGIACTTELPSFDTIAVLGLLFAVLSLILALLARL
ncbi:uncharacterized protein LOC116173368 isoform X1 [Photinus pyralis]|uniref:uncharacterized protein LOC116173368 isoform X1 n=2 Tax=Photinus pyralis TaxID=7054 RepID=UPI00126711BC|nr:uncharacterized protein LOC116173368 isoform X1 [Photinus pyralis]